MESLHITIELRTHSTKHCNYPVNTRRFLYFLYNECSIWCKHFLDRNENKQKSKQRYNAPNDSNQKTSKYTLNISIEHFAPLFL